MKTNDVALHITNWLKEYAKISKINGFIIGISGGIDSAVTSTLCAMTDLNVICLEMPIQQNPDHVLRAKEHINFLKNKYSNVQSKLIDLNSVYKSFCKEVSNVNTDFELALANTRARLRMSTLYYYATINNYLVVGTGNKVEDFGVGFYTKYGDGGVDISPIADLLKSQVYKLGSVLGIVKSIMSAKPSDGLYSDSRTDEDQIGATYDELEWAMEFDKVSNSVKELSDRKNTVLTIYREFNLKNKHKMIEIPVCKIPLKLL
jgi:NAD+ synthase